MTQEETQSVRLAAKSVLGWYKDTQRQKQVRTVVEKVLDSYDRVLFREKCDKVFHLMHDYASYGRKWAA